MIFCIFIGRLIFQSQPVSTESKLIFLTLYKLLIIIIIFEMTQNDQKNSHQEAARCIKCKDMYGNSIYDDMCSSCYKKQKNIEALPLPSTPVLKHQNAKKSEDNLKNEDEGIKKRELPKEQIRTTVKGKCIKCSRKTGILGFECRHCSNQFCKMHRLPQEHQCEVDYITMGKKKIKTQNPNISMKKIEHF